MPRVVGTVMGVMIAPQKKAAAARKSRIETRHIFFMTSSASLDIMHDLLGVDPLELTRTPQSLEWTHNCVDSRKAPAYEDCNDVCHALYIFMSALVGKDYPRDGLCLESFLRGYIHENWQSPHSFDSEESTTWADLVSTFGDWETSMDFLYSTEQTINHEILIMAFTEFMAHIYLPVIVRVYFDDYTLEFNIEQQEPENEQGPHFTIDIRVSQGRWFLLKTNSMHRFRHFSPTTKPFDDETKLLTPSLGRICWSMTTTDDADVLLQPALGELKK